MGRRNILRLRPPFEQAASGYEREIMRFLLRMTHDPDDSLDIFQETWLRAYRAYPRLESIDGLRPWLFRIAANLWRNHRRDRRRRYRMIGEARAGMARDGSGESASHGDPEIAIHLRRLIAELPARQHRALIMRKFDGLSYGEIGTALGCSAGAARASVYQAKRKLRHAGYGK